MSAFSVINMNHSLRYQRELEGDSTAETAALARRALALIACGKATHDTFRSLDMDTIAGLVKTLEAKHFWLGKCPDGSFIRYLSEKPLKAKRERSFVGAIGPFFSPLGAAYYARQDAGSLKALTPQQAERLAREDDEGSWSMRREQILLEMSTSEQERDDYERDMAAEYEDGPGFCTPEWHGGRRG